MHVNFAEGQREGVVRGQVVYAEVYGEECGKASQTERGMAGPDGVLILDQTWRCSKAKGGSNNTANIQWNAKRRHWRSTSNLPLGGFEFGFWPGHPSTSYSTVCSLCSPDLFYSRFAEYRIHHRSISLEDWIVRDWRFGAWWWSDTLDLVG